MGLHSHSVTAAVDPRIVWDRWTDVEHWPADDPDCEKAQLNGPLAKGALGWTKPRGGRRVTFRIAEVDRRAWRFALESKLPLGVLVFGHTLQRPETSEEGVDESADAVDSDVWVMTHTVTITGPLAKVWDRLIGRRIAQGLPVVMDNIVKAAAV